MAISSQTCVWLHPQAPEAKGTWTSLSVPPNLTIPSVGHLPFLFLQALQTSKLKQEELPLSPHPLYHCYIHHPLIPALVNL